MLVENVCFWVGLKKIVLVLGVKIILKMYLVNNVVMLYWYNVCDYEIKKKCTRAHVHAHTH